MRPRPPPSLPTGFRWVVQLFVIIFFTGLLWYSVAGANHILATWGIWIPCFACFLVFPSAILRPPGAIILTLITALTIETTYPDLRGWMIPVGLLISADLIRRRADYRIRSWNLMLVYATAIHWLMMLSMTILHSDAIGPSSAFFRKLAIDSMAGQVVILLCMPALAWMCTLFGRLHLNPQDDVHP